MLCFGQDGCPYCKSLVQASFGSSPVAALILAKTQQHFTFIATNIWGDLDVTWIDGTRTNEKGQANLLRVLFKAPGCAPWTEMHAEAFRRPGLRRLLRGFDVARLLPGPVRPLTTPDGRRSDTRAFARDIGVQLYPTVVLFDAQGREAFRFDGYMRPFHIESAFDFVASSACRCEPQFQRFVQARAERLEREGQHVDLWR